VASAGLPGFEVASVYAIFAPARTPVPIIDRLNREIVRFLARPEVKEKLIATGVEAAGSSPEELVAAIQAETARMGKVIREAGLRED
jgi:tripartite-type tricarboxylate transporter receptor subunit TctC